MSIAAVANPHLEWHNNGNPNASACWSLECRGSVWQGTAGLKPEDLRYSVVFTIEECWRPGEQWPKAPELDGVSWSRSRPESCHTEDGFVAFRFSAAMDWSALVDLCGGWDVDNGESGGLLGPTEGEDHWAPSVILTTSDGTWRVCVTAWPKRRAGEGDTRFDEWDSVVQLLTSQAWSGTERGFTES